MTDAVARCVVLKLVTKEATAMDAIKVPANAFSGIGNWTSEQTKLALYFYCQTPFGQLHSRNKKVIALAQLIGRTPGAVAKKCGNLASLDPAIVASGRVGLTKHSQLDVDIWNEFHADWERLTIECEQLRQYLLHEHGVSNASPLAPTDDFALTDFTGETRQAIVQQRIKQNFFRRAVLSSYRGRCCISAVSDSRLLVASHIVAWSVNKENRLNPSNGLCLSAIHDKAFDKHLFSLTNDNRIVLSDQLKASKDVFLQKVFWPIEDRLIELPERFRPELTLIRNHREVMLRNQT